MAEGLLRRTAGDRFDVFSAGSQPTRPHPLALQVLQERGIDVSGLHSKSVAEFVQQPFDYVITLCAEEICPVFPGAAARLHWPLPDPSATGGTPDEQMEAFRRTAAELERRLNELVLELPAAGSV